MRAGVGGTKVILEDFRPGTAPPDNFAIIGADGTSVVSPGADRALRGRTGPIAVIN
jgi:penicillin-binding protein 1A